MKQLTMKKSVIKAVFTLSIALSIFMHGSTYVSADNCNHDYSLCMPKGSPYPVNKGYHTYIYSYDEFRTPIYRSDCEVLAIRQNCEVICSKCQSRNGLSHYHDQNFHSINHK